MKIAIIGSGNIGSTLAEKWAAAGHEITFGVRDQSHFKGEKLLGVSGISVLAIKEAVAHSEIVLVATPAIVAVEVAQSLGDTKGKVIIDTMNIVGGRGPQGYSSTAHALREHTSGEVVKAFNTTGFNNIKSTAYGSINLDMFMAGNSIRGKEVVRQLAIEAGFANCYDIGDDSKFEMLEQFANFWINLAMSTGLGREIGFKLLKR